MNKVEVGGRLGVQVVEGVGLVASSFQFFTRFAAVFTEEVGDFFSLRSEMVIVLSIPPPVEITLGSKLHQYEEKR